jgi:predicted AlkP superfamily phosphohydrolase/phosphomutase
LTKVAVFGLDGVPYGLLTKLAEKRIMPNMSAMMESYGIHRMETVYPPISSCAWTSFMTGKNPGDHGIFGFTDVTPGQIALRLPSFDDIKAPVVWNLLPDATSLVINLPFTYPARPLKGALVCGFVSPIFERAVYPDSLIPWLKSMNYVIDVDASKGRENRKVFLDDLHRVLTIREQVTLELMRNRQWDWLISVITETDRLNHFFYDACEDENHPFYDEVMRFYTRVDAVVGAFLNEIPRDTKVIMLSDHGFMKLRTQIYMNRILEAYGYLKYKAPGAKTLSDVAPGSKAFALEPGRIYLNHNGRLAAAELTPDAALQVRAKLKSDLERLTAADIGIHEPDIDPGTRLFESIKLKEEIYSGACMDSAPDLVAVPTDGFDLKATINPPVFHMKDVFTGTHNQDAFFVSNIANAPANPKITDICGMILTGLQQ